jgi:phosphonate transport system permease protein
MAGLALIVVVVATIMVDTVSGAIRRRIIAGPKPPSMLGVDAHDEEYALDTEVSTAADL